MDDTYIGYRFLLLALIVLVNAFFAAAEMALISVRQGRLRAMADQGVVGAQAGISLLARPERFLSTVQVGVTLAGLGAGWAGEDTVYLWLTSFLPAFPANSTAAAAGHIASFVLAFLVLTYFMVVLGEVVPKNLGIKSAERIAVIAAPVLLVFYRISEPFVFVLERSASAISRVLGVSGREPGHSVEDLKLIASSLRTTGRISDFEAELVERAVELRGISVRQIMVPRNDIVSIPVTASLEEVLSIMMEHQHARVPVHGERPEEILGILYYKDLWPALEILRPAARRQPQRFRLRSLLRKHLVVPETKPLDQMIQEFLRSHTHMAMVVDEFGTIVGLVTLEDVMEQLIGEIQDEHDIEAPSPSLEAPTLELEGTIGIRDLIMRYGIELPENAGFETLAGFLLFRLGHIPLPGEVVEYDARRFTILEMDRRRIARVRIDKLPLSPAPEPA